MLYHTLISKKNDQFVLGYDNAKGFVVSRQVSPYQFKSKEEYISALKSIQQDVVNFEVKTYCLIEAGKRPTEGELKAFLQVVQKHRPKPVSYTHLTLPTNREV